MDSERRPRALLIALLEAYHKATAEGKDTFYIDTDQGLKPVLTAYAKYYLEYIFGKPIPKVEDLT